MEGENEQEILEIIKTLAWKMIPLGQPDNPKYDPEKWTYLNGKISALRWILKSNRTYKILSTEMGY